MKRREFIALVGGAAATWPLAARAQQSDRVRRIGFLRAGSPPVRELEAFRRALADSGFVEGRNYTLVAAWGDGDVGRLPQLAATIASSGVDVVVVEGANVVRAMHAVGSALPIVMAGTADPFVGGLVPSLARPGGSITGFASQTVDITPKMIEVLSELVPNFARIAMVGSRTVWPIFGPAHEQAAKALRIETVNLDLPRPELIGEVLDQAVAQKISGVVVRGTPFFSTAQRKLIVAAAGARRMPAMYESREYVEEGGLTSYGPNKLDIYRRAADYVVRILNGANPGDLPIQQPTKFELVINLSAAKALGLAVPATLLASADEVIE